MQTENLYTNNNLFSSNASLFYCRSCLEERLDELDLTQLTSSRRGRQATGYCEGCGRPLSAAEKKTNNGMEVYSTPNHHSTTGTTGYRHSTGTISYNNK